MSRIRLHGHIRAYALICVYNMHWHTDSRQQGYTWFDVDYPHYLDNEWYPNCGLSIFYKAQWRTRKNEARPVKWSNSENIPRHCCTIVFVIKSRKQPCHARPSRLCWILLQHVIEIHLNSPILFLNRLCELVCTWNKRSVSNWSRRLYFLTFVLEPCPPQPYLHDPLLFLIDFQMNM